MQVDEKELYDTTMDHTMNLRNYGKFGQMPPEEAACSEMVAEAFLAALEHYEAKKSGSEAPPSARMITKACAVENGEKERAEDG